MNKKMLSRILMVLIILVGVVLVFQGFMWGILPAGNLENYNITVVGAEGMNMIRSDIGGPLMIAGVFAILYAVKGQKWFLPTLILASSYLVVRVISLFLDGFVQVGIMGVAVELVFVILVIAKNRIDNAKGE